MLFKYSSHFNYYIFSSCHFHLCSGMRTKLLCTALLIYVNRNCGQKKGTKYEEEEKLQTGNTTQKSENVKKFSTLWSNFKKDKIIRKTHLFSICWIPCVQMTRSPPHMLALSKTDKTNGDNSDSVIKTSLWGWLDLVQVKIFLRLLANLTFGKKPFSIPFIHNMSNPGCLKI